jgi:hypothetical protein
VLVIGFRLTTSSTKSYGQTLGACTAVSHTYIRRHTWWTLHSIQVFSTDHTQYQESLCLIGLSAATMMIHQASSCKQARRGRRRVRHFRLGSLLRLRMRLFRLAGLVVRCLEGLNCCPRRRPTARSAQKSSRSRQPAGVTAAQHRESSASFHADQAIADCLEFIKRSYMQPVQHDHGTSSSPC